MTSAFNRVGFFLFLFFILISCQKERQPEGFIITEDKNQLFYHMTGHGEPVLVIHGGPGLDHSYLRPHLDILNESCQLIYFDQRAAGRSSFDLDSSNMNLETLVQDIEFIRQKLNLGKIHLLAHSFGGIQAMQYAISHSQNLKSLILISSSGPKAEFNEAETVELASRMDSSFMIRRAKLLNSEAAKNEDPAFVEEFMKFSFSIQFYNPEKLQELEINLPKDIYERREKLFLLSEDLSSYNFERGLRNLNTDVLMIYGNDDPGVKISGKALNTLIRSSTFHIIPECGHFPFIEKPEEFKNLIVNFLSSN